MSDALENDPRVLSKVVPSLIGSSSGGTLSFENAIGTKNDTEGWKIVPINDTTSEAFLWQGYIDLAGYELEQLTFFINGINIQENQVPVASGNFIHISDLITKTPITEAQLNLEYYPSQIHYAPGFGYSLHNMEEVLMGQLRTYYHDSNWTLDDLQMMASQNRWGEGSATAANRIYITRLVSIQSDEPSVTIPNANYQVAGIALDEPDLEYIMRLRRDYELAVS
tara:strand:+ start:132 stop:803 length:672 start_codon:yes stop_codon:yes gene_type:complete